MKFRELREQIERSQPPIIVEPPTQPGLDFTCLDAAIAYIIGYCNKHPKCSERCRLYDVEDGSCIFFDSSIGPPCDWKPPKREEDEKDV